jgi:hypothetical protein
MFLLNSFFDFKSLTFAAIPSLQSPSTPPIDECMFGGVCPELSLKSGAFQSSVTFLLAYFFEDPDSVYQIVLVPCQIIAGLGALYFLIPLMLDFGKQNYGMDINKIIFLFILMLMFANNNFLGKSIAFGNYAFIQGIHKLIVTQLSGSTAINRIVDDFKSDRQKVLQIRTQLSICDGIPNKTTVDANGTIVANSTFSKCDAKLRNLIRNTRFSNPLTAADFAKAVDLKDYDYMSAYIKNASMGFPDAANIQNDDLKKSQDIPNFLIGWRAAIAIVPDIALIAALLYFPFPLAFSFLSTSYLQGWFSAIWSVGLFKFAMTIFNSTFVVVEAALAGYMPQNTVDLATGIVLPSIAMALATGSGLGLSGLLDRGISNLPGNLNQGTSTTNTSTTNATRTLSNAKKI